MRNLLALYLSPGSYRVGFMRRHARRLREQGVRLHLAEDVLVEEDRSLFDGVLELPPCEDVSGALALLRRYCRQEKIDALLLQTEASLLAGTLLGQDLGLRTPSPAAIHNCVNKYATRRALSAARVPVPPYRLGSGVEDVRKFARTHGFPLLLKPVASVLGKFIQRIEEESAIEPAARRMIECLAVSKDVQRLAAFAREWGGDPGCDPRREYLIEAYHAGTPLEMDGILRGESPRFFGVIEQEIAAGGFYMAGYQLPAELPAGAAAEIERVTRAALAAVALRDCGFAIELRRGAHGVSVIEINPRLGEDDGFARFYELVLGEDPLLSAIDMVLGNGSAAPFETKCAGAIAYLPCTEAGVVCEVPGVESLRAFAEPGIEVGLCVDAGEERFPRGDARYSPHLAYAIATDPRDSRGAYQRARAAVEKVGIRVEKVRETSQRE